MSASTLAIVPGTRKSPQQAEIERLAALDPSKLDAESLAHLRRIRDCRESLEECENEMAELREARKLKKESLAEAVAQAAEYASNRQMALNFGGER